jgi:biopolymer transport protein ExbB
MHQLMGGFEMIQSGGFMMYPLLLSALIALAVIIERGYLFATRFKTPAESVEELLKILRGSSGEQLRQTPLGAVLAKGEESRHQSAAAMELAMKNCAESWIPKLEKRIDVLDTVITAAPLMGLLGTITGMMGSFRVLSEKGVNEPNAITGGVAEALIATATGLVIALVCLVAYNYFLSRIKTLVYAMESAASSLLEMRERSTRED